MSMQNIDEERKEKVSEGAVRLLTSAAGEPAPQIPKPIKGDPAKCSSIKKHCQNLFGSDQFFQLL